MGEEESGFLVGSTNFMPEDEPDRLVEAYGGNMQRLQAIKARYDPGNLFRVNHNIKPMVAEQAAQ